MRRRIAPAPSVNAAGGPKPAREIPPPFLLVTYCFSLRTRALVEGDAVDKLGGFLLVGGDLC